MLGMLFVPTGTHCGYDGSPSAAADCCRWPSWVVLLVIAATVVALLPVGSRSLRKSPGTTEQAEAGVPVSVA
jgi:hypothetical protein